MASLRTLLPVAAAVAALHVPFQAGKDGTGHVAASLWSNATLRDWQERAFLHLPCFEDAEPKGTGAIVHERYRVARSDKSKSIFNSWDEFSDIAGSYLDASEAWLLDSSAWPLDGPFAIHRMRRLFGSGAYAPFVQRLDLPSHAEVSVFGDLHGAFHSLLRSLQSLVDGGYLSDNMRVVPHKSSSFYMLFLGDYVDRGYYGVETLALLLTLRLRNPGNVFMARGNHEDTSACATCYGALPVNVSLGYAAVHSTHELSTFTSFLSADMNDWGSGAFHAELHRKFGADNVARGVPVHRGERRVPFHRIYDTLPAAIFLGVRGTANMSDGDSAGYNPSASPPAPAYLQCCHGGIEAGWEPFDLLLHGHNESDFQLAAGGVGASSPLASGGAEIRLALLHGYARADWLAGLPPALRSELPHRVQNIMKNVGYAADVNVARAAIRQAGSIRSPLVGPARCLTEAVELGADGSTAAAGAPCHLADNFGAPIGWDDDPRPPKDLSPLGTMDADDDSDAQEIDPNGAWPAAPTHGEVGNGFMWSDFITHDPDTPLIYQRGRGLAFGLSITHHITETTPIVGFLRAHQHNNARDSGAMLDAVADAGGAFDNWQGANASGHVVTFLSGAHIPHLGFGRDSYGLLSLPSSVPSTWSLDLCGQDVGEQYIVGVDGDEGRAKLDPLGAGWAERLTVFHACDARVRITCEHTHWRPAGSGTARRPR